MKHLARTSWLLSILVLLCGCGGGYNTAGAGNPGAKPPDPNPHGLDTISNWQFSTTSTVPGTPPATLAGSINRSGSSVTGAVHVDGSNCFDRLTTVGLTGTLTGSNISLTSASVAGQVLTFTGSFTGDAFTGTYTINGGCGDGDHGNATGSRIPIMANILNGTFTASGGEAFASASHVAQDANPGSEGSFGLDGTATFTTTSCFTSGTIAPGAFPSGSFIIGTSVALEIETSNGTVAFLGTLDRDKGEISGDYTVTGGTCDQAGKAVLVASSPWDY